MVETISARPMSFDDIQRLIETGTLEAYQPHTLLPHLYEKVTFTVAPSGKGTRQNPVHITTERNGEGEQVGVAVNVNTLSEFGIHSGGRLFTTLDAEKVVASRREYDRAGEARRSTFIAAPGDRPDAIPLPLVGVFGAQVNVTVILGGLPAGDDVTERVERALAAEFADADAVRVSSIKSRPVSNVRVDVYALGEARPLAVNVLECEASMHATGAFHVEPTAIVTG